MEKHSLLTRILAIAGTVLVGLPILAPVLFSIVALAAEGRFHLDYLMPAELFPAVLLGVHCCCGLPSGHTRSRR